ncbi:type III secretion system (T3SS) SseB-like protein [Brevibacterium sanguinis]|uniref:Type III secretion system (T3SS) SseB-like protein n=2 Tax=Brevibacterium TaxID=1696 RepID=A0A366INU7_9MICO|nr:MULTISPECIES: SseB family protein [Brevibacterium]RBP67838.1 type III secretion system (T3SS) SseB-like protein [Brevibacterium sanguinis]RBP74745.1 type III secretion system (T3SS) SseB-like protein [Brevibacterium celere]
MSTDSAGRPWAGRELKPNPFSGDTGLGDEGLLTALQEVQASPLDPERHRQVLAALAGVRLYAPIVPIAVDHEVGEHGHMVDNSSEMAMVRLQAEDGRECTPGFCSIPPLTRWHDSARPVPIEAERLVLGAIEAGSQLVVLDPGAAHSFLLRRPALFAFAQGQDWTPSWADAEVGRRLAEIGQSFPWLASVQVSPGSGSVHIGGAELGISLGVKSEVSAAEVQRFQQALAADPELVEKIDSLAIRIQPTS